MSKSYAPRFTLGPPQTVSTAWSRLWDKDGLDWRAQCVVFLVVALAIFSRRPDCLLNPQFYAKDGSVWYADAYNFGWLTSLASPSGGYLNTLQRLIGSIALLVPFHLAPLLMNLLGIAVQVLPVNALLSARCSNWSSLRVRALQAIVYVALPNSSEIDVNVTNAQFHLALLGFILAFAKPPARLLAKGTDCLIFVIAALSGPFGFLMLPLLFIFWWKRRYRWTLAMLVIIAVCSVVQIIELFNAGSGRPTILLGESFGLLLRILDRQVYAGALLGGNDFGFRNHFLVLIVSLAGTAVIGYTLLRARLELKLFVLFCSVLLGASLYRPLVAGTLPAWYILFDANGIRYWVFPMVGFIWSLVWMATQHHSQGARVAGVCLLLIAVTGMIHDWEYPPYADQNFPEYARQFELASAGSFLTIPIYPDGWVLKLAKKGGNCQNLPTGTIDAPAPNAVLSGPMLAEGWVTATEKISQVFLYVDGSLLTSIPLTAVRPDVDRTYPRSPDAYKGFQTHLDLSALRPGNHVLEARALQQGGCNAEFSVQPFRIAP